MSASYRNLEPRTLHSFQNKKEPTSNTSNDHSFYNVKDTSSANRKFHPPMIELVDKLMHQLRKIKYNKIVLSSE